MEIFHIFAQLITTTINQMMKFNTSIIAQNQPLVELASQSTYMVSKHIDHFIGQAVLALYGIPATIIEYLPSHIRMS